MTKAFYTLRYGKTLQDSCYLIVSNQGGGLKFFSEYVEDISKTIAKKFDSAKKVKFFDMAFGRKGCSGEATNGFSRVCRW